MKELYIFAGNVTIKQLQREDLLNTKYPCMQCNYHVTTKESVDKDKKAVHEGVKYSCRQCENQATNKNHVA